MCMNKKQIRDLIRRRRMESDLDRMDEKSMRAQRLILGLPEFIKARNIGCYLSMPREVGTSFLMNECWRLGKTVWVPALHDGKGQYHLSLMKESSSITYKFGNVPEPARVEWVGLEKVEFIVVPGVAFDGECGRVGHGGGHYDRILAGGFAGFKAGLAFEFQIMDSIPVDEHDVKMNVVVTEERIIRGAKRRE